MIGLEEKLFNQKDVTNISHTFALGNCVDLTCIRTVDHGHLTLEDRTMATALVDAQAKITCGYNKIFIAAFSIASRSA